MTSSSGIEAFRKGTLLSRYGDEDAFPILRRIGSTALGRILSSSSCAELCLRILVSVQTTQGGTFIANTPVDALQRTPSIIVGGVGLIGRATASSSLGVPRALAATPSVVYEERSTLSPTPLTMTSSTPTAAPSALAQPTMINNYKTIDVCGANVHIAYGASLTIQFVQHVIIHNLHIHDIKPASGGNIRDSEDHWGFRTRSDGDGVSIFGSSNIWIDHLSLSNCANGLIDVVNGSTVITISNCHLTHHNDVILLGASDSFAKDAKMQDSVAYNHFGSGLVQSMPRYASIHIMYAIGGNQHPTIISQGNRFVGPPNQAAKEVTHRIDVPESVWKNWNWRSEGDLFKDGAFFVEFGAKFHVDFSKYDFIKAKAGSFVGRLTRFLGSLNCKRNPPC
ncbi:hypothetical protein Cni_G16638 [Canna indica]|uniref:Pectate lyase n=1 Tax=Canna indica TaxID=4628 RepID=A0AAQ3QG19_9LILI|nr:hypothetical protein Cni_G16638 [Canna indica]